MRKDTRSSTFITNVYQGNAEMKSNRLIGNFESSVSQFHLNSPTRFWDDELYIDYRIVQIEPEHLEFISRSIEKCHFSSM